MLPADAPSGKVHPGWKSLLEWLVSHGMKPDDLAVECRTSPGAGHGLYATRPVSPGTPLLKIPSNALINIKTLSPIYSRNGRRPPLSAIQLIAMHFFLNRPQPNSPAIDTNFGPYIAVMPIGMDSHPLSWLVKRMNTSDVRKSLLTQLPPSVTSALSNLRQRFYEDFDAVCKFVVAQVTKQTSRNDPCVVDDFLWAWLNVNTRCIYHRLAAARSDPNNVTMVPIVDFANHTPGPVHLQPTPSNADSWDTAPQGKYGEPFGLSVPAGHAIQKGDELFLQYGKHSNRVLFVEYGFVNTFSKKDIVDGQFDGEVNVQDLVEELFHARDAVGEWMKTVLVEEGYWGDWTLHCSPAPAYPSYRLITALRLLHIIPERVTRIPEDEADNLLGLWRSTVLGRTALISSENEEAWRNTLRKICAKIVQRGQARVRALVELLRGPNVPDWWEGSKTNVQSLWEEEVEVASVVQKSVDEGIEF